MLESLNSILDQAIGLHRKPEDIGALQMSLRALIIFAAATAYIRVGSRRFIGRSTSLDVVLGIIFGSVISRAVTGNAPFFPTLAASLTLVALHWVLSSIAAKHHAFGRFVKGSPCVLIRDGRLQHEAMAISHISEHDLEQALRVHGLPSDFNQVKLAMLERNGDVSVVPKDSKPPPETHTPPAG